MASDFYPILQSAPVRHGVIGAMDLTSWLTGLTAPYVSGVYKGDDRKTLTLTCDASGSVGITASLPFTWTVSGGGPTGVLDFGTDVYTLGDFVPVWGGVSAALAFGSGLTVVDEENFSVDLVPGHLVRPDHAQIVGDGDPCVIELLQTGFRDRDQLMRNFDEQVLRDARAMLRIPSLSMNYMTVTQRREYLRMIHDRHEVTFGENYDYSTLLLHRGASEMPTIGRMPAFSRVGGAAVQEQGSGRWLANQAGPRITLGPERGSYDDATGAADYDRHHRHTIPSRWEDTGPAISLSGASATNLCPDLHPLRDDASGEDLIFTTNGNATITFDPNMPGVLADPSQWDDKYLRGTARAFIPADQATNSLLKSSSSHRFPIDETLVPSAQIYLKGTGSVKVALRTGAGTPSTVHVSETFALTMDRWTRCVLISTYLDTPPAGHDTGDLVIEPAIDVSSTNRQNVTVWISAMMVEESAEGGVSDDLVDGTRALESQVTYEEAIPMTGSLAFWFRNGEDIGGLQFRLLQMGSTGANNLFYLQYHGGTPGFVWDTNDGAQLITAYDVPSYTWVHVGMTWELSPLGGTLYTLRKKFYLDGVLQQNDVATANYPEGDPEPLVMLPAPVGGDDIMRGIRYAELRMDSRVLTDQEMFAQFDRINDTGTWGHVHRELAGRKFWFGRGSERRLAQIAPDKFTSTPTLEESGTMEPVTPR